MPEFKNTASKASFVVLGEMGTPILDNRPVVTTRAAREMTVKAGNTVEAVTLIAGLPQRLAISHLVIRPTLLHGHSGEIDFA